MSSERRYEVLRFVYAMLAAAFAADAFSRLFCFAAAFLREGVWSLAGTVFSDADGRMFLSLALGALFLLVGFPKALSGKTQKLTLFGAEVFLAGTLFLLHAAVLPGRTGIFLLGALFVLWQAFALAAAVFGVIRAYSNFTNHLF